MAKLNNFVRKINQETLIEDFEYILDIIKPFLSMDDRTTLELTGFIIKFIKGTR